MGNSKGRAVFLTSVAVVAIAGFGYARKNNLIFGGVFDWGSEPVVRTQPASEDSLHVEYPSVFKVGDVNAMLYSGYGDDHRWRIKLATAKNDTDYVKQGNIFDEKLLPFKGAYAFPFVRKKLLDGATSYELYFSVTEDNSPTYSAIYRSISTNGLSWGVPKKLLNDSALDPVVFTHNGHDKIMYTSMVDGDNLIKSAELNADGSVGPSNTVLTPESGIYTLGVVHINSKPVFFVETESNWDAYCLNASDKLVPASHEPIVVLKESTEKKWDGLKYGMFFFEEGETPAVYYNGIEAHGIEQGGQIGVASYDVDSLTRKLDLAQCQ